MLAAARTRCIRFTFFCLLLPPSRSSFRDECECRLNLLRFGSFLLRLSESSGFRSSCFYLGIVFRLPFFVQLRARVSQLVVPRRSEAYRAVMCQVAVAVVNRVASRQLRTLVQLALVGLHKNVIEVSTGSQRAACCIHASARTQVLNQSECGRYMEVFHFARAQ